MKFVSAALAFLSAVALGAETTLDPMGEQTQETTHHRMMNAVARPLPMITFFVPLQEQSTFDDIFRNNFGTTPRAPMVVMLSVTTSTDKTVIWYDHWENGFDVDPIGAPGPTTEVWGDNNAANGCSPHLAQRNIPCTNLNDVLNAGTSIVIRNEVPIPRDPVVNSRVYDGGDRIQASFPIAVTKASFPSDPGSLLAGAVEVYDTTLWGNSYEAPVGAGTIVTDGTDPFEVSGFSCLASQDNTRVTKNNVTVATLAMGQSVYIPVARSDRIHSDKPIQVVLLTLDKGSTYETRWFTMRPTNMYSTSYVSPVGDSIGSTLLVLYNPNPTVLSYTVSTLVNGRVQNVTRTLNSQQAVRTDVIPTGSGAVVTGSGRFVALSLTDSARNVGGGQTNGDIYDWGCPLTARDELTSQVLVGLGYGCTNNACGTSHVRSPIFLTAMENADIYIDYQNTGSNQVRRSVNFLESIRIEDSDKDMSGALIFAVRRGDPINGQPVDIAVAWGQNPANSFSGDGLGLDMGTVVPPFPVVRVAKSADKTVIGSNEELTYTIRISNVGNRENTANSMTINDVLDSQVTYVPGSTRVSTSAGSTTFMAVPDGAMGMGTPFPLDENGYIVPVALPRRGGTVDITFRVRTASQLSQPRVVNRGTLRAGSVTQSFEVTTRVSFAPAIAIQNTVYNGHDGGVKCGTPAANETATGLLESDVTYCYRVTNTGNTHLASVRIQTAELNYTHSFTGPLLAPNAVQTVFIHQKITAAFTNNAVVVGTPVLPNGASIDATAVTATDPSNVIPVIPTARVNITNTVYIGADNGASCSRGQERVSDIHGTSVVYCFTITNVGQTHLNRLVLRNNVLNRFERPIAETLAPGRSTTVSLPGTITMDLDNLAEVVGMPIFSDGRSIPGLGEVRSSDPSAVTKLTFRPSIVVENTVYLGKDGGKQCGTPAAVEYVSGFAGTDVTYCFRVTNTGETHLNNVALVNSLLQYTDNTIGRLAPKDSVMRTLDGTIRVDLKNFANVTGNPITSDGRDIPDLADVVHSDPSEVNHEVASASIALENTVLIGRDGALCSTSAAQEYVEDFRDTVVTYCFTVKNNGKTHLDSIKVNNPTLGVVDAPVPRLAPGVATTIFVVRTITGKVGNEATVRANPTTVDGVDIADAQDVTAKDTSSIGEIAYVPKVHIVNTVYLGNNGARSCGTAGNSVEGLFMTQVTYCFHVSNTGNTHLDNFRIGNDILKFYDQTTIATLAPGASAIVTVRGTIRATHDNSAKVTARPIKQDKTPLPMGDVWHSDPSDVVRIPHKPSIVINNTVYIGAPGSCHLGVDTVRDITNTNVSYCLRVTNTGDTHLSAVRVVDTELNINQMLSRTLAPRDSELISVPGTIKADLRNTAVVTANPVLPCGTDIEGIPDVTHNDWSSVERLVFSASIAVANTVYLGHDGGKSCSSASELVQGLYDTKATFCFKITNTGQTHLRSITLSNGQLSYNQILTQPLAPTASAELTFAGKILATQGNMANVTAVPITADGRVIVDISEVRASDPSGVELVKHAPVVTIANTVYLGNDGGKSCATSQESVSEQFGKTVTYCFKITNDGNSFLNNLHIDNEKLQYSNNSTVINLAPGASTLLTTTGKISTDLINNAVVTATPSLSDGSPIPNQDKVTAKDPSSVTVVAHKSGINIENTVYLSGSDGGAKCATLGKETASGYPNTGVMYCFEVKNVGESHLKDIVITNTDLNFTDSSIKLLAPQESKIVAISRMIVKDLINNATASATPALADGTNILNAKGVTDSDTSAVDQLEYAPKIVIENSVYVGRSSDNLCGTNAARDGVDGIHGTAVTYCFKVTNIGNTPLKNVVIGNVNLDNYNSPVKDLTVNETVLVTLEKTITMDLKNTAKVTANPTIAGLSPVSSQDDSGVNKFDFLPGVKIVNKVLLGSGDVAKCGTNAALESVEGVFGTVVTYCFTILNTGDTHLADIKVNNKNVDYSRSDFAPLASGDNFTVAVPGTIAKTFQNTATVIANPVTSSGQDIPDLMNVQSEDDSGVVRLMHNSSVQIVNTVYLGQDGGKQCGTAVATDSVSARFGVQVTYCFQVTNIGQAHLTTVIVDNKDVGYTKTIDALAPNATVMLTIDGPLTSTKTNLATVTGTPSLPTGSIIPDMTPVASQDSSAVVRIPDAARIVIDNLVVLGSDTTKCDSNEAADFVEHYQGATVTYCFEVVNKGDTHLADVVITNAALNFTSKSGAIGVLRPGDSALVVYTSKIGVAMSNMAVVTANPVLPDGTTDIADVKDVTWSDGSAVGLLEYKPAIVVANTVYLGNDGGAQCVTKGVEQVTDVHGSKVVYCFNLTNRGDTYLNNIKLVNVDLNYTDNSISIMAPQQSILVAVQSSLTKNLTNHIVVTANPSLADGMDISGAQDVTATDPSSVVVKKTDGLEKETPKTPYSPPKNGTQCLQDKWTKAGQSGTLLCSTKQVGWETLSSTKPLTCKLGETVTVTVDGTMRLDSGNRHDLGWYIAADGGDALTGQCIVNGLQSSYTYMTTPSATSKVVWLGDTTDTCGDVQATMPAMLNTPALVSATLKCADENEDGILDASVCFTWRSASTSRSCDISNNIPGSLSTCYCTRYDIKDVVVEKPRVATC